MTSYNGADRLAHLGSIMRAARALDGALNELSRTELQCLCDLCGASPNGATGDLQVKVRRRLMNLKPVNGPNG